jgi:hypothetical protein
MFDLEARIRQWRENLGAALGGRPEVVEELEGHLRDEVDRLVQAGQTPEQAWQTALGRLGSAPQLAAEFGKLPPGPVSWLPGRLVVGGLVLLGVVLAGILLYRLGQGRVGPLLAAHVFAVTAGYTIAFAVGALTIWSILAGAVRGPDARQMEALRSSARTLAVPGLALSAVGVVLGGCWAQEHLGRAWGWDLKEVGGLCVLAWYAALLGGLWRLRTDRSTWLLGLAGNVVVSLGWFGPALAEPGHASGAGAIPWVLAGFVLVQVLLVGVALVPAGRWARRTS